MNDPIEKTFRYVLAGIGGFLLGAGFIYSIGGPIITSTKIFRENGQPAVMRIYRRGTNPILVEKGKDDFTGLDDYLNDISDNLDRAVEESRIK